MSHMERTAAQDLADFLGKDRFSTILADPPWRFTNRTGKVAPEHKRLSRYPTLTLEEICDLPVADFLEDRAHCYLWVPNALLPEGHRAGTLGRNVRTLHSGRRRIKMRQWRRRKPSGQITIAFDRETSSVRRARKTRPMVADGMVKEFL